MCRTGREEKPKNAFVVDPTRRRTFGSSGASGRVADKTHRAKRSKRARKLRNGIRDKGCYARSARSSWRRRALTSHVRRKSPSSPGAPTDRVPLLSLKILARPLVLPRSSTSPPPPPTHPNPGSRFPNHVAPAPRYDNAVSNSSPTYTRIVTFRIPNESVSRRIPV